MPCETVVDVPTDVPGSVVFVGLVGLPGAACCGVIDAPGRETMGVKCVVTPRARFGKRCAILSAECSENQIVPSEAASTPAGRLFGVGDVYSVIVLAKGFSLPTMLVACSANQRLPKGSTLISSSSAPAVGTAQSVITPPAVRRPTKPPVASVKSTTLNHLLPWLSISIKSGPTAPPSDATGIANSCS